MDLDPRALPSLWSYKIKVFGWLLIEVNAKSPHLELASSSSSLPLLLTIFRSSIRAARPPPLAQPLSNGAPPLSVAAPYIHRGVILSAAPHCPTAPPLLTAAPAFAGTSPFWDWVYHKDILNLDLYHSVDFQFSIVGNGFGKSKQNSNMRTAIRFTGRDSSQNSSTPSRLLVGNSRLL